MIQINKITPINFKSIEHSKNASTNLVESDIRNQDNKVLKLYLENLALINSAKVEKVSRAEK